MKLLAVILVFMIAAQPATAGFCDMGSPGEAAAHAGMSHHASGQDTDSHGGHDCCDPDRGGDSGPSPDCGLGMDCGYCVSAVTAVAVSPYLATSPPPVHQPSATHGALITRHTSPPFRPPIFAS